MINTPKMFALTCDNSTDCISTVDLLIKAPTKGKAWNILLSDVCRKKIESMGVSCVGYLLFEVDNYKLSPESYSVVACDDEHIEFKFPNGTVKTHFDMFSTTKFGKVDYKMTNDKFAEAYDDLVQMFVYGKDKLSGCTDDPFKAWSLNMIQLKHYDSEDKYVVVETTTHDLTDATTVFSTSTEYVTHDCDDMMCEKDTLKYYSYKMSDIFVV